MIAGVPKSDKLRKKVKSITDLIAGKRKGRIISIIRRSVFAPRLRALSNWDLSKLFKKPIKIKAAKEKLLKDCISTIPVIPYGLFEIPKR